MNQLGKYEILAEIGRGGFGIVYSARDLSLERMVALKVLHPQLTVDASFLERFRKEAKALARINHPNVVTIHEIGEIEGRIYIAMEYLPGGSLADRLVEGPLSWPQALEAAREIGSGLEAGHQEGLIHRDVKPGNILFNKYGTAVIVDFGLAKAMQSSLDLCDPPTRARFERLIGAWKAVEGTVQCTKIGRIYLKMHTRPHKSGDLARLARRFNLLTLVCPQQVKRASIQVMWGLVDADHPADISSICT